MPDLFAPYQGQQVAPVPPGYIQGYTAAGDAIGRGISAVGEQAGAAIANWKQMQMQAKAADYMVKSYDAKGPDGGTVNPMLDKAGIHRDQWDTLGAREKTMAVQGIMKGMAAQSQQQEIQAKTAQLQSVAQDNQARAMMLQQQSDEAEAMGAIAPKAADWAKANPGKQAAATDILGWMGDAKLNPRTQAAVLGKLIPSMMGTAAATETPQAWTSPQGNPYVMMGHTLMPDKSGMSPEDVTAPAGYSAVPNGKGGVQYLRDPSQKGLPPAAQGKLTEYLNDITSANDILGQSNDELKANASGLAPDQLKASATARLKRSQQNAKNLLDLQKQMGTLTPEEHAGFYSQFGLGGTPGAAGGRVPVWKDGKQFTVPAEQKDAAVKAGYSLTK